MLGCLAIIGQKNLFEKKASQKKSPVARNWAWSDRYSKFSEEKALLRVSSI